MKEKIEQFKSLNINEISSKLSLLLRRYRSLEKDLGRLYTKSRKLYRRNNQLFEQNVRRAKRLHSKDSFMANNQQIIELKQEMNICNDKIDEKHLKLQALEKQIRETSEQYRGKMDQARWIFKEEIEELDLNDYWESITIKVSKNGQVNFYPFKNASRRTKSHGHIILNHRGELIYRRDLGQSHGKQNFIK